MQRTDGVAGTGCLLSVVSVLSRLENVRPQCQDFTFDFLTGGPRARCGESGLSGGLEATQQRYKKLRPRPASGRGNEGLKTDVSSWQTLAPSA